MNCLKSLVVAVSVALAVGCQSVDCACSCEKDAPKISVFAKFVRNVAKERNVSLKEAADLLYGLGVRGYDCGPDEKDLPELAATRLRPINFYYFPGWFGDRSPKSHADVTTPDECLAKAVRYGVPRIMVVPPNFTGTEDEETEFREILVRMRQFVSAAKARGVQVTVEDFGGRRNCCSQVKYLKRFLDEIPDIQLALDSGNLYFADRGEDILDLMAYAKERIGHVHLKDQTPECHQRYQTLGLGGVPNERIVTTLNAAGYDGWYTLENTVVGADTYVETARQTAVLRAWLRP